MMKRSSKQLARPLAVMILLLGLVPAVSASAEDSSSALDFTATALDGSPFSGTSLSGKAVLLDFWGSWCAPCVHAFPTLKRLHEDFGDRLEVVGLAYYSGELSAIAAFAKEYGLAYTVAEGHDDALDTFGVFAFPSYVLISPEGEIVFTQAGEMADLYERVAEALAEPTG